MHTSVPWLGLQGFMTLRCPYLPSIKKNSDLRHKNVCVGIHQYGILNMKVVHYFRWNYLYGLRPLSQHVVSSCWIQWVGSSVVTTKRRQDRSRHQKLQPREWTCLWLLFLWNEFTSYRKTHKVWHTCYQESPTYPTATKWHYIVSSASHPRKDPWLLGHFLVKMIEYVNLRIIIMSEIIDLQRDQPLWMCLLWMHLLKKKLLIAHSLTLYDSTLNKIPEKWKKHATKTHLWLNSPISPNICVLWW